MDRTGDLPGPIGLVRRSCRPWLAGSRSGGWSLQRSRSRFAGRRSNFREPQDAASESMRQVRSAQVQSHLVGEESAGGGEADLVFAPPQQTLEAVVVGQGVGRHAGTG